MVGADTLAALSDYEMVDRFREYNEYKATYADETERINKTHREFGNTYWWYHDFSQKASGELQKMEEN